MISLTFGVKENLSKKENTVVLQIVAPESRIQDVNGNNSSNYQYFFFGKFKISVLATVLVTGKKDTYCLWQYWSVWKRNLLSPKL